MSLRIRRGTEAQRLGITPDMGEIIWTTNGEKLYVGDGVTVGGKDIAAQLAGTGLLYNATTGKLDSVASFTTDQVTEGVNNKYFSQELAQDAIGAAILAGTQSGITVTYTDNGSGAGGINFTVTPDGVGITQVADDTTPALGGDLDLNSNDISGTGNIDITGTISASAGLGGNLDLNGQGISGSGSFSVTTGADSAKVYGTSVHLLENIGITTGLRGQFPAVGINVSRGTLAAPVNTQPGDFLGAFAIRGLYNDYDLGAVGITGKWADDANLADGSPKSELILTTGDNNNGFNVAILDGNGTFNAPVIQPNSFTSVQRDALTPVVGMMIYNSTVNKFQGYQNTAGTTLEWVDLS